MAIKVIVYDDNKDRRESLKILINIQPEMACTGIFKDCLNVWEDIVNTQPDVILMDIDITLCYFLVTFEYICSIGHEGQASHDCDYFLPIHFRKD